MARLKQQYQQEGFYGIGLFNFIKGYNVGTLWRSAFILGASFIYTIGQRYERQGSDVVKAWTKIPLFHYDDFEDFYDNLPHGTLLVGAEMCERSTPLASYEHPLRAVYLLGSEANGLPPAVQKACHSLVQLPGEFSLNVAVTGSLIMYDRISKQPHQLPARKFTND